MLSLKEVKNFKYRINPTEGIEGRANFGYYVVRPISVYFTWLILQTPMSANQVTVLHMIIGILGSILLAFADLKVQLAGIFFLYLSYVIDNVDGEVARYRKQVSITGKYIDTLAHTYVIMIMFFGFGFGAFMKTGRVELVVLGFLAGFFSLRLDVFAMYLEAAQSVKSHLDKNYDYYADVESKLKGTDALPLQYISKKAKNRGLRFLFAVFAFPGILHIFATLLLVELVARHYGVEFKPVLPSALAVYLYGALMPIRRLWTFKKIVSNHETERIYLKLNGYGQETKTKDPE
ncbi:MAG: CDP-alcohol phosphatidyltransferase family protein [bacterium]